MKRWSYLAQFDNFHNYPFTSYGESTELHSQANASKGEMREYILSARTAKFTKLKENPQIDDVISRMLEDRSAERRLRADRWGVNIVGLLVGAVETTSQAVAQAVDELLKRPIYLEQAKEAARKEMTSSSPAMSGRQCGSTRSSLPLPDLNQRLHPGEGDRPSQDHPRRYGRSGDNLVGHVRPGRVPLAR